MDELVLFLNQRSESYLDDAVQIMRVMNSRKRGKVIFKNGSGDIFEGSFVGVHIDDGTLDELKMELRLIRNALVFYKGLRKRNNDKDFYRMGEEKEIMKACFIVYNLGGG